MKRLREKTWYPYTIAACIAVALYVLLAHLGTITAGIGTFLGYFRPIAIGAVLAYIINPLAKLLQRKFFGKIRSEKIDADKLGWTLSIAAAVIIILLILGFLIGTLIPQLIDSVSMLVNNMDSYAVSLKDLTDKWGLSEVIKIDKLLSDSDGLMKKIQSYLASNANSILNAGAAAGKSVVSWVIALILSVYLLAAKDSIKAGVLRLMRAVFPEKRLDAALKFVARCDKILVQYIVFSLIDALIVGMANALFMLVTGMQYIGLVSMIVGITNLVPTFGPIIGGVTGALILLFVNPVHALIFIIFTFVLQFLDPYVIKPKLFGNSLGVSGLLILISVIVFGNMFGIVGILIAIPVAAIIDFVYMEALLPALENRRAKRRDAAGS